MTITRETLELAAKAAGIELDVWDAPWRGDMVFKNVSNGCEWRPHLDGNDAGELARKLHMLIDFEDDDSGHVMCADPTTDMYWPRDCSNWKEAATLCAAAVQRAKEGGK